MTTLRSHIVPDLSAIDYRCFALPMFTLYAHPSDFPGHFVLRLFDIDQPTDIVFLADTEDQAVMAVPEGFVRLNRNPADDPVIVATYI